MCVLVQSASAQVCCANVSWSDFLIQSAVFESEFMCSLP